MHIAFGIFAHRFFLRFSRKNRTFPHLFGPFRGNLNFQITPPNLLIINTLFSRASFCLQNSTLRFRLLHIIVHTTNIHFFLKKTIPHQFLHFFLTTSLFPHVPSLPHDGQKITPSTGKLPLENRQKSHGILHIINGIFEHKKQVFRSSILADILHLLHRNFGHKNISQNILQQPRQTPLLSPQICTHSHT